MTKLANALSKATNCSTPVLASLECEDLVRVHIESGDFDLVRMTLYGSEWDDGLVEEDLVYGVFG